MGGIGLLLFRASPRLAFVAWAIVMFFVPLWVGASAGIFWSAITALTLAVLCANIADMRLHPTDAVVAGFIVLVIALFALKAATLSATVIAILEWTIPYAWGRMVLARVSRGFVTQVIAVVATVAAVLGLVEFVTGVNVFTMLPSMSSTLFEEWGPLQERGGLLRVEGAFGHSISFGAAMAMSSAFVLATTWPVVVRLASLLLILAATAVTFSRIGLVTLAIAVVLALVLLPGISRAMRWSVAVCGAIGAAVALPLVAGVFLDAGDEAGGSADYRGGLFVLLSQVRLFGASQDWSGLTVNGDYLGAYANSVDNAFLLFALRFGWVASIALVLALVMAAATVLSRNGASPPAIAVASQLPTLFVVALITQFGMYLWFMAGLAVAWSTLLAQDADRQRDGAVDFMDPPKGYSAVRP